MPFSPIIYHMAIHELPSMVPLLMPDGRSMQDARGIACWHQWATSLLVQGRSANNARCHGAQSRCAQCHRCDPFVVVWGAHTVIHCAAIQQDYTLFPAAPPVQAPAMNCRVCFWQLVHRPGRICQSLAMKTVIDNGCECKLVPHNMALPQLFLLEEKMANGLEVFLVAQERESQRMIARSGQSMMLLQVAAGLFE